VWGVALLRVLASGEWGIAAAICLVLLLPAISLMLPLRLYTRWARCSWLVWIDTWPWRSQSPALLCPPCCARPAVPDLLCLTCCAYPAVPDLLCLTCCA
jgi:hypothetical protein